MDKSILSTETVLTSLEPRRTLQIADECLLEIRVIESRSESTGWIYEYEIRGESGRFRRFLKRIKVLENG